MALETRIRVSDDTKDDLQAIGQKGDRYEDVIRGLLDGRPREGEAVVRALALSALADYAAHDVAEGRDVPHDVRNAVLDAYDALDHDPAEGPMGEAADGA